MKKTFFAFLFALSSQASGSSLSCLNEIGGNWNFATAPSACDVSPLLQSAVVEAEYRPVIYEDGPAHLQAYLSQMYPLLRETGKAYIHRRNPQVSDQEEKAFLEGLFTLAHQESFWTHYRKGTDQIIRYMRGDALHGHGLMQVDDRSHVDALKQGRGVDLVYNIMFGLDIYYQAWTLAPQKACLKGATDYQNRARAAWSAYNGGIGAICRWKTNPSVGDRQYLAKITQKQWLQFVVNQDAPVLVDIQCLMLGQRPCQGAGFGSPWDGPADRSGLPIKIGERIEVVAPFGINLRQNINANIIGHLPKFILAVVDDIAVQGSDGEIYLKISSQIGSGFIYAGHLKPRLSLNDWVSVVRDTPQMILKASIPYEFLRTCGSLACAKTLVFLESRAHEPVSIIGKKQSWVQVETLNANKGWIAESDLEILR